MSHPNHLAIIMDGNGRWAKGRFLPRIEGHRRGVETVRTVVKAARSRGIEHLSVFAFSSENWNRPREEVNALLNFFVAGLKQEAEPLLKADVRLHVVGDRSVFSDELVRAIEQAEDITRNWSVDRVFRPAISEEERTKRIKGWNKAVRCAYHWARDEEE